MLLAMELLYYKTGDLCLITLQQPATLILWSPLSGTQIWKKTFSEPLFSFTRDPFDSSNIICTCTVSPCYCVSKMTLCHEILVVNRIGNHLVKPELS